MENIQINKNNIMDVIDRTMNLCNVYMSIYVLKDLVTDKDDYQAKLLNIQTELQQHIPALLEYKKKKHTLKSVKKTIDRVLIYVTDIITDVRNHVNDVDGGLKIDEIDVLEIFI